MELGTWQREVGLSDAAVARSLDVIPLTVGRIRRGERVAGPRVAARIVLLSQGKVSFDDIYASVLAEEIGRATLAAAAGAGNSPVTSVDTVPRETSAEALAKRSAAARRGAATRARMRRARAS